MKAIQIQGEKGSQSLVWQEVADPVLGPDEVLVDVYAAAVNRADLAQRAGHYPPPPGASDILGLDVAGQVAQAGRNVTGWQPGDRVCALVAGGGYAERAAVPGKMLMRVPKGWGFEQAAALPEVFLTAYVNIFMEAAFVPGEVVLIHGGASGVGTAAIQLVAAAGGQAIVTVGSDDKAAACRKLGAALAINYRTDDFAQRVREHTAGRGVDIVIDLVGAAYLERNLSLLALKGRMVIVSTLSGGRADIDLGSLMGRRLRLIGSVLRARPLDEKAEITRRFVEQFWPALEDGTIQPLIDSVYPIAQADEAHRRMAENRNTGKIVLKVREI